MARQHKPDIVVLDINMPRVNGLLAYKKISEENPRTACIIISAEKNPSAFRAAMSIGIQHYLIKPFTSDELEKAMRDVIRRMDQDQTSKAKRTKPTSGNWRRNTPAQNAQTMPRCRC
jgi:YesN/AraC family two-component response regulator